MLRRRELANGEMLYGTAGEIVAFHAEEALEALGGRVTGSGLLVLALAQIVGSMLRPSNAEKLLGGAPSLETVTSLIRACATEGKLSQEQEKQFEEDFKRILRTTQFMAPLSTEVH